MVSLLLFVIGCYVLAAAFVHVYYQLCQQQAAKHYVLLSVQPNDQMEWVFRCMHSFSRWMGIPVKITIVQTSHCYELTHMANCWGDQWFPIDIAIEEIKVPEHAIVIDMNKEHDRNKLPF